MAYTTSANAGIMDRLTGFIAEYKERAQRARIYRTTRDELNALSGRELADLGISRSEIKRIAYEAAYQN